METGYTFCDVEVIVDGVIDQVEHFSDETLLREFISEVREDAAGDGYPTEIYIQYHDHDEIGGGHPFECNCAQYAQSHKPAYTFNMED